MSVWRVIWRRGLWNVNEKERWRNEREKEWCWIGVEGGCMWAKYVEGGRGE